MSEARFRKFLARSTFFGVKSKQRAWAWLDTEDSLPGVHRSARKVKLRVCAAILGRLITGILTESVCTSWIRKIPCREYAFERKKLTVQLDSEDSFLEENQRWECVRLALEDSFLGLSFSARKLECVQLYSEDSYPRLYCLTQKVSSKRMRSWI